MDKRILAATGLGLALALSPLPATEARAATPAATASPDLAGPAVADSLRTNLWLVEALLGEIVGEAASALPPAPARVALTGQPAQKDRTGVLMRQVAIRELTERGYEVLAGRPDSLRGAAPEYEATFVVDDIVLTYPEVGRTLGLWRRWVDRDVNVVVSVEIAEPATGRLLLSERLSRHFSDRVTNDEFPAVNSRLYPFTSAEIGESGWNRRLEEFAVLGTLVGLIAVYFANTGD